MNHQKLKAIASQYGTPAYLFNLDAFTSRVQWMKELLGSQVKICYAMKANPFFTQIAASTADLLEVCSPGELAICQREKVEAEKIVLSGVYKDWNDIESVMENHSVFTYTAESINQLELLEYCAAKTNNLKIRVLLRISSGNQFGMDEETILTIISQRETYPHLDLKGIQYYSGTQKKKVDLIYKELFYLDELCTLLKEQFDFEAEELEYGPGFYIPYFQGEQPENEDKLLTDFKQTLNLLAFKGQIVLEMGRFLAAPCGCYLTQIVDLKQNQEVNYCIIDGGINHINYYGQTMAMKIPPYRFVKKEIPAADSISQIKPWTICGALCTAGDVLIKNLPLPDAAIGDLLIFDQIGAYSVTEGIYLFLSRKLPCILFYSQNKGICLVRQAIPTDPFNSPETENLPVRI